MKCPKCGSTLRPSKQQPGSYLCDTCRKRFRPNVSAKTKAKRKRRKNRKRFITLLFIIVAVILAGVLFTKFKPSITGSKESDNYAVGAIASTNGIELQITDFKRSKGTEGMKPAKNNEFLILNVTITNSTKGTAHLHALSSFKLIADKTPVKYSAYVYEAEAANINRLPETLEAGESFNGNICFEIPSKASNLILEYSNPVWSTDKLVFDIK